MREGINLMRASRERTIQLRRTVWRSLLITLAVFVAVLVIEGVGALLSGSVALLAEAIHVMADTVAVALELAAMRLASRPATVSRTFGLQRTEVLVTLINTLVLWVTAGWIMFESSQRFSSPPQVSGQIILVVGSVGLIIVVAAALVLRRRSGMDLSIEEAFQHVMAEVLSTGGLVIAGILMLLFEWWIVDPILGILIGLLIMRSSWRLLTKVLRVLLEETPARVDVYALCSDLEETPGVTLVHDVHAWTITSSFEALSAHVLIDPGFSGDVNVLLSSLRSIAYGRYGLAHVTLQIERAASGCQEDHHVEHLLRRFAGEVVPGA